MSDKAANNWLYELGFQQNPFDYQHAEQMTDEAIRQATYVEHYEVERFLRVSTVILTTRGGGKTSAVFKIRDVLHQIRHDSFNGFDREGVRFLRPLVVHYNLGDEQLIEKAGQNHPVSLKDHIRPLLQTIAEPLFDLVATYPENFLKINSRTRIWIWTYLQLYLEGTVLDLRFTGNNNEALYQDWLENKAQLATILFNENSRLSVLFEDILGITNKLGLDSIMMLVDSAERFEKTVSTKQQANLLRPLLNATDILSIDRLVWQFFLPDNLQDEVNSSSNIATGRLATPIRILWTEEKLQQLLQLRLEWASNNLINSLNEIVDPLSLGLRDIDAELIQLALKYPNIQGAPRALLMIGDQFLAALAQKQTQFTKKEWQAFCAQLPAPASPELIIENAGLSSDLISRLRNTLEKCEQFRSSERLRAVFTDERLNDWYSSVPEDNTVAMRVQLVISWLLPKRNKIHGNGLVLLLCILRDSYPPQDQRHEELAELAEALEQYLSSLR